MGTMTFLLPANLPAEAARELERGCVVGGPDGMPWPTELRVEAGRLLVRRAADESGYLHVPWDVASAGRQMCGTATVIERQQPYSLAVELARGKVNQLRCQAADWEAGGLQMPADLGRAIHDATFAFGKAALDGHGEPANRQAQEALTLAAAASDRLVQTYIEQMFHYRHQRQPKLDTTLGCRLGPAVPGESAAAALRPACNAVCLPLAWSEVEPVEAGSYQWEPCDELVRWAAGQGWTVSAGPLIDFSSFRLPGWLWLFERDLASLANFMCGYVQATVRRYRDTIRTWQLTTASNCATVLSLDEDELLWLTVRLVEAARQVDPGLELLIGLAQPWGDYMAREDRVHSPFIFADTLIRAGLNLTALDLELVMGVSPRGSYCRDLLEASRILDLYALLGVPTRVTLGYPARSGPDADADPELSLNGGHHPGGHTDAAQADWAAAFGALALCKPSVTGVQWCHFSDAEVHQFPHCGLVRADGTPRPALDRLRDLRARHLR